MDKWKITWLDFGFLKIVKGVSLTAVVILSFIGMWTAPTSWVDTMWTCIWCLSLVNLVDMFD